MQKSGEIQYSSSSKAVHSSCCSEKKSQFYIFFNIFFNELWFLSLSFSLRFPKFFLEIQHVKSNIYIYQGTRVFLYRVDCVSRLEVEDN